MNMDHDQSHLGEFHRHIATKNRQKLRLVIICSNLAEVCRPQKYERNFKLC